MDTEVFIAGAGLAGLSLALALQEQGTDYLLAEARGRSGGRILTLQRDLADIGETVVDVGPSWIWPGQPRVARLLQRFGLEVFEQYSDGLLVYEDELGRVQRDLDFSTMAGSLRVAGGLSRLTDAIAQRLDTDTLLYQHRVTRIESLDPGYRVSVCHGEQERQLTARKVVLAIPPRVIARDICFEPGLAADSAADLAAIPTWMAGHAKLLAIYPRPFWRDLGLSGDAISRRGPLAEIHDASPADVACGALFGFVGVAAGSPLREPGRLRTAARRQLASLFGETVEPLELIVKDWFDTPETATRADAEPGAHPAYGTAESIARYRSRGLLFASTEMAPGFCGFIEGALEAAEAAYHGLQER